MSKPTAEQQKRFEKMSMYLDTYFEDGLYGDLVDYLDSLREIADEVQGLSPAQVLLTFAIRNLDKSEEVLSAFPIPYLSFSAAEEAFKAANNTLVGGRFGIVMTETHIQVRIVFEPTEAAAEGN